MMGKAKYEEPVIQVISFEAADILTTSADAFDGEWVPISPQNEDGNNDFVW